MKPNCPGSARGSRFNRLGAIVAAALATSAIASVTAVGTAHAAVGDAYCSGPPTNVAGFGNSDGGRWGETFSPINGGYLAEVRLFVEEDAHNNDTLTVRITQVNGSDLSPVFPVVPLATATVPDSSVPLSTSYPPVSEVAFDFPDPPPVSASSEYAIVLTRSNTSGAVLGIGIVGSGSSGDPCPDGALYDASGGPSDPWGAADTHHDAVFTTFVSGPPSVSAPPSVSGPPAVSGPPSPPAPAGPTGRRAAALAKCKKKHSHKAKTKCRKKARALPV